MSVWSERTKREKRLVAVFGVVLVLGGGMKVMAAGSDPVPVERSVSAPVTSTPPAAEATEDDAAEMQPIVHPTGPGSKRDPFVPLISADGGPRPIGDAAMRTEDTDRVLKVDLVDIYPEGDRMVAIVDLNEDRYRGGVGKVVGDVVQILELSDRCAVFEHAGTRFGLCVGQSVERPVR